MAIWLALLGAPMLALCDQVVAYAAVGWACTHDGIVAVHAVHAICSVLAVVSVVPAWQLWVATGRAGSETVARRRFLAGLAVASAALSALVIAAMWMPTWVIGPCVE